MAGFRVSEHIAHSRKEVRDHLTDWRNAKEWMTGVDDLSRSGTDPWRSERG